MRIGLRVVQRLLLALFRRRVPVLLALVIALSGMTYLMWRGSPAAQVSASDEIPVEVAVQSMQRQGANLTVTLKEKNGPRRITMVVGDAEAHVIAAKFGQRLPGDQPAQYDLIRDMVQQMGGRVDRVLVNRADAQTYHAEIQVSSGQDGHPLAVTARPSDAVALALSTGAPIFVDDRVLEQFGVAGNG
jgi:bifunctional DNase/RNase